MLNGFCGKEQPTNKEEVSWWTHLQCCPPWEVNMGSGGRSIRKEQVIGALRETIHPSQIEFPWTSGSEQLYQTECLRGKPPALLCSHINGKKITSSTLEMLKGETGNTQTQICYLDCYKIPPKNFPTHEGKTMRVKKSWKTHVSMWLLLGLGTFIYSSISIC